MQKFLLLVTMTLLAQFSPVFLSLSNDNAASAQKTQKGYVRTVGRPKNKNGIRLNNVVIKVKGVNGHFTSGTKKNKNGVFELTIPANKNTYQLSDVSLANYELNEKEVLDRVFGVTNVDHPIVMISKDEQNQIRQNVTKQLEKQYQNRVAELNAELKAQKISIASYQKQLDELQTLKDNSKTLISEKVDRYSHTDYNDLSDKDVEIYSLLEEGELSQAKSLIDSNGNIDNRLSQYESYNKSLEEEQRKLDERKAAAAREKASIIMQCKQMYDLYTSSMQFDSAAIYIQKVADIDSLNFNSVYDCAKFYRDENYFPGAEKYYLRSVKLADAMCKEDSTETSIARYARALNGLGYFYQRNSHFKESERYLLRALVGRMQLAKEKPDRYDSELAGTCVHLGNLYMRWNIYSKASFFFLKTMELDEQILAKRQSNTNRANLANAYSSMGNLYRQTNRHALALEYHKKALDIYRSLVKIDPEDYNAKLATTLRLIAIDYGNAQSFTDEETCISEAKQIMEDLVSQNKHAYEPPYATLLYSIGQYYNTVKNYDKALTFLTEASRLRTIFSQYNPSAYNPPLAQTLVSLSTTYCALKKYDEAKDCILRALTIRQALVKSDSTAYNPDLATTYNGLAALHCAMSQYSDAENYYKQSIAILEPLAKEEPNVYNTTLSHTYSSIASLYELMKETSLAKTYSNKAQRLQKQ